MSSFLNIVITSAKCKLSKKEKKKTAKEPDASYHFYAEITVKL